MSPRCGAHNCPMPSSMYLNGTSSTNPTTHKGVFLLMGIFLGVILLATIPLVFLVNNIIVYGSEQRSKEIRAKILAPMKLLKKDVKIRLMMPFLIFNGMMLGFTNADFTKVVRFCFIITATSLIHDQEPDNI